MLFPIGMAFVLGYTAFGLTHANTVGFVCAVAMVLALVAIAAHLGDISMQLAAAARRGANWADLESAFVCWLALCPGLGAITSAIGIALALYYPASPEDPTSFAPSPHPGQKERPGLRRSAYNRRHR